MGFRLGLAQCCHPADGDVMALVEKWAAQAKETSVDLLVFPESLMTPFELSDDDFASSAEPLDGPFCQAVDNVARKYGLWMVYTANERNIKDGLAERPFNTAVVVDDEGCKQAVYRKVHLFDTDFVKESNKVTPGNEVLRSVQTPFGAIGVAICYDVRFPEQARAMALAGCDVLLYPAAWVDGPRKVEQWRTLLRARAIENELFVAGLSRCDRAFGKARRNYAGHSCVYGPLGDEIASAGQGEELLVADIDTGAVQAARSAMPILRHRRPELY